MVRVVIPPGEGEEEEEGDNVDGPSTWELDNTEPEPAHPEEVWAMTRGGESRRIRRV